MQAKYCILPDKEKFFGFLSGLSFSKAELMQLRMLDIKQICIDESACLWEIHYDCIAHLTDGLIQAAADRLAAAFSLQTVLFIKNDGKIIEAKVSEEEPIVVEHADCCGVPSFEDIPLPEEPPEMEIGAIDPPEPSCVMEEPDIYEQEFAAAYDRLYGEKKDNGLIWGKKITGKVRPIDSIIEEENKVVIEGEFVKTLDKDSNLTNFNERELRTKDISLTFNLCDGTGGIYIKMRFSARDGNDAKADCKQFFAFTKALNFIEVKAVCILINNTCTGKEHKLNHCMVNHVQYCTICSNCAMFTKELCHCNTDYDKTNTRLWRL